MKKGQNEMNTLRFMGLTIYYPLSRRVYNEETNQVIFINQLLDEIHGIIEIDGSKINLHPRFNVHFSIESTELPSLSTLKKNKMIML